MIFSTLATALGGGAAIGGAGAAAAGAGSLATGISAAAGLVGTAGSLYATKMQFDASKAAAKASQDAEDVRKRQSELEQVRQRRQVIRQSLAARAEALQVATNQGAAQGSGLQGGFGQIAGQTGENITGLNNSEGLGNAMFAANARATRAGTRSATATGISNLSGALVSNQNEIGRVTANFLA